MKSFDTAWEEIHATEEWGKYPSEYVIRFVARNYYKENRKNIKILDFGCGAGSNTWFLAREGFDTYAFDGSQSAVDKAKKRFEKEGLEADFRVCDALETGYEDNFFDCVIDCVSIYANQYEHIIKMYEAVYRILKSGGRIFTSVFSKNTTGYGLGEEIERGTFTDIKQGNLAGRGTVHFFDQEEITGILEKTGFQDIQEDLFYYTDRGSVVEQILIQAKK